MLLLRVWFSGKSEFEKCHKFMQTFIFFSLSFAQHIHEHKYLSLCDSKSFGKFRFDSIWKAYECEHEHYADAALTTACFFNDGEIVFQRQCLWSISDSQLAAEMQIAKSISTRENKAIQFIRESI